MIKKIVTLIFCGISFITLGQDKIPEKRFLSLRAGLSLPQGNFGSMNFYNEDAGFAQTGFSISAEYGGFLTKNLGLSLTGGISRNGFEYASYNSQARSRLTTTNGWRSTIILGNLIGNLPLGSDFSVYLKAGGGFTFNTYPGLQFGGGIGTPATKEEKVKAESLAYGLGSGFRWYFGDVGLGAEAYYLISEPTFKQGSVSYKQEMNDVSLFATLSFLLK